MPEITFDNECNNVLKYHNHLEYVVGIMCYMPLILRKMAVHMWFYFLLSIIWPAVFFFCVCLYWLEHHLNCMFS